MQLSFLHDEKAFDDLASEWNALLSRSSSDVPFLRHEYLRAWWSTLGGGEWPAGDLWIGSGRQATGELAGLAPLFFTQTREGRPGLMLLGSVEISDYLDLLVPTGAEVPFAQALLQALDEQGPAGWQVLDLYNLPEASPNLSALEVAARQKGWLITRQRLQPCPVAGLPGDWESYLSMLDKKQRHELRRKVRRTESYPGGVSWRIVGPEESLQAAAQSFMGLMALDPQKAGFLTPAMRKQFMATVEAAHQNGWLQLALLEVAGRLAAGYLNFDYGGRIWVYNSGLDPEFQFLSPGWVLLAYLIQWAIEHGRKEFDFLRGDEDYKYRLGGLERSIFRLTIERRG